MPAPEPRRRVDPPFAAVLVAAKAGENWAFRIIHDRWNQPLTAFAVARGAIEVDDTVSETFLGAFAGISRFDGSEAEFRAWMFRILRNKIVDGFRRAGRTVPTTGLPDQVEPVAGDVECDAMRAMTTRRVGELLAGLTGDQAEVLLLRLVGDLTIAQISQIMGKRPGAIKAHQRRGLAKLRQELGPEAGPSPIAGRCPPGGTSEPVSER